MAKAQARSHLQQAGYAHKRRARGLGLTLMCAAALCASAGCKQQKKKSSSQSPPKSSPSVGGLDQRQPTSPATSDGFGDPPFVGQAELRPFTDIAPQSGRSLARQMNEVGELIYGYDMPFDPYTLDPSVRQPSQVEVAAEQCMNEWLGSLTISLAGTGGAAAEAAPANENGYRVTGAAREAFEACMRSKQVTVAAETKWDFKHNIFIGCDGEAGAQGPGQQYPQNQQNQQYPQNQQVQQQVQVSGQAGPSLDGVRITSPNFTRGFCEQGRSARVRYNVRVEVSQLGSDKKVLRLYRRTKALTNRSGGDCEWNWNETRRVKVFSDCVFLDRVDASDTATHRFALVTFNGVEGHQSLSGGFHYTGGSASVQLNDFQGTIAFSQNAPPSWTLSKQANQNATRGIITVPQGHGRMPGSYPGGGSDSFPGGGVSYVPVRGPGGAQEIRGCEPSVVPQNFEIGGGEGNGVVSLWRSEHGDSVYHAGYVHTDRSDARRAFVARVRGYQLVWCRTYMVQQIAGSMSEGVFIGDVGGGQFYAAFIARQNVYVPVGNPVFQASRPQQDSPVAYLVRLDPNTGNVSKATWFDFGLAPGGKSPTIVLDGQGLGTGFLRLRAALTQGRPPGCNAPGSGTYGVQLRADLSGLASQQPENCPGQGQF